MVASVGALAAFYHEEVDVHDPISREIAAHRLIAKMPTIAAMLAPGMTLKRGKTL